MLAALLGSVVVGFTPIGGQMLGMQKQIGGLRTGMRTEIGGLSERMARIENPDRDSFGPGNLHPDPLGSLSLPHAGGERHAVSTNPR